MVNTTSGPIPRSRNKEILNDDEGALMSNISNISLEEKQQQQTGESDAVGGGNSSSGNNDDNANTAAAATKKQTVKKKTTIPKTTKSTTASKIRKSSTSSSSSTTSSTNHGSYVFVRVRPLLSQIENSSGETKRSHDDEYEYEESSELLLEDLITETQIANETNTGTGGVVAMGGALPIGGFNGVFGTTTTNKFVFQQSFLPRIDTIMKGGTSSFFCYGYTGAGKTHTTLGYSGNCDHSGGGAGGAGGEYGVFRLAAEELFQRVRAFNEEQQKRKEDADNNNNVEQEGIDNGDATVGDKIKTALQDEPYFIMASVMEVYNDDVYDLLTPNEEKNDGGADANADAEIKMAKCTLRKNKKGQLLVRGATQKHYFTEEEAEKKGVDYSIVTKTLSAVPIRSLDDLVTVQERAHSHRKVGTSTEHSRSSRSHAIFRLDVVNQTLLDAMQELEEQEQIKPAVQTAYDKKRTYQLRHWVLDIEKKIDEMSQFIDELYNRGAKYKLPFGGRMILVDLAGADSDHRAIGESGQTVAQRKESTAINKSLMALKECICGLSSSKPVKSVTFRNSSLTRLLEEVLTPREKRSSDSVMVVNIGPEGNLKNKTVNSLRYGSMYSSIPKKKPVRGGSRSRPSPSSSRRGSLMEARMRMKKEMQQKKEQNE